MDTLDLLQDVLGDYDGTLVLVSHDRDFLDRIVTSSLVLEGDGKITEYPGGYSDYLRQRKSPEAKTPSVKKSTRKADAPKQRPARLSYKHSYALEQLPGEIARLEKQISQYQAKLGQADFYTRDPDGFHKINQAMEQAKTDLAVKEDQWIDLEMLREEIESP